MRINQKLKINNAIIVGIVLLIGIASAFSLYKANDSTDVLVKEKFGNVVWANTIANNLNQNAILIRDMFIQTDDSKKESGLKQMNVYTKHSEFVLDSLEQKISDPNEKMIFAELKKSFSTFNKSEGQLLALINSGDFVAAIELLQKDFSESQNAALKAINKMVEFENNQVKIMGEASSSLIFTTLVIVISLIGIAIIIGVYLSRRLSKHISNPLEKLAIISNNIAKGKIELNLNSDKDDEIGELTKAMALMSRNIDSMVQEANQLANETINGNWAMRAEETKYEGEFYKLMNGINNTLDALTNPLNMTAEYVSKIAVGEIPQKITGEYSGNFAVVNENLNKCIEAINLLVRDSNTIFNSAIVGNLNYRADDSQHNGDFRSIIGGVNSTLNRLVGLIDEMPVGVQIVDKSKNIVYQNKIVKS